MLKIVHITLNRNRKISSISMTSFHSFKLLTKLLNELIDDDADVIVGCVVEFVGDEEFVVGILLGCTPNFVS